MNCIKCNKKMEKGFLRSWERIMWSKNKSYFLVSGSEDDKNVKIAPLRWVKANNIESYICKDCRIVITKY